MKEEIKIRDHISATEFVFLVDAIASQFFSTTHEYQPHIGRMNAMRLFYAVAVEGELFGVSKDADNINDMTPLFENDVFIRAFNTEIVANSHEDFTYGNAYYHAMEIVDDERRSRYRDAKRVFANVKDILSNVITEENIAKIAELFSNLDDDSVITSVLAKAFEGHGSQNEE